MMHDKASFGINKGFPMWVCLETKTLSIYNWFYIKEETCNQLNQKALLAIYLKGQVNIQLSIKYKISHVTIEERPNICKGESVTCVMYVTSQPTPY